MKMEEVKVNFAVSTRLRHYVNNNVEEALAGVLLGYITSQKLHIVGCTASRKLTTHNITEDFETAAAYVPGGVSGCGIFFISDQAKAPAIIEQVCQRILPTNLEEETGLDSVIVCAIPKNGQPEDSGVYWYSKNKLTAATVDFTDSFEQDSSLLLRLTSMVPLSFEFSKDKGVLETNLNTGIEDLKSKLLFNNIVLQVEDSDVLLHQKDGCLTKSLPTDAYCSELLSYITRNDTPSGKKSDKNKQKVIGLRLLQQISGDRGVKGTLGCAPIINHDLEECINICLNFPLDVLAVVPRDSHMYSIPTLLLDSAVCQLNQVKQCLLEQSEGERFYLPKVYHFKPSALNHIVSVVYPEDKDEKELEDVRRRVHDQFLITSERPTFKKIQAYCLPGEESNTGGYLENTHVGLGPSGVKGGEEFLVDGKYTYHHYMQDRFDDDKWGCAYRSLQTLVSWFRLQGYTAVPVPTHRQIQHALVQIGDKEQSFVGSRKWIGSTEVSYVLDHLLGVTSKIMFVSAGAELANKGRELAIHFQTQGTPIMIGGGVLAHTILGVDFNESSGDVKFLILDPHYTGAEELKVIQDKGWCGWKGPEFWDQNAYYNLCMPQRPEAM